MGPLDSKVMKCEELMLWELSILDWDKEGADNSVVTPDQVLELITAADEEQATKAYWKLDGLVCSNGLAYGASINAVNLILAMLPNCPAAAKRRCLELIGQISVCESDVASPYVVEECLEELRLASWYFLHGLQFDVPENAWLYVDLIGVLGEKFSDFRPKAKSYLEFVLKRSLPASDVEMIQNTLAGLSEI